VEEADHGASVGRAGIGIADLGGEELGFGVQPNGKPA
jgi:hypothetical protein